MDREIKEVLKITAVSIVFGLVISILFAGMVILPINHRDVAKWGDGYCSECHEHWDYIGMDKNAYMYACRRCYKTFWINEYRGDWF